MRWKAPGQPFRNRPPQAPRLFRGEGLVNWIGLLVVVQNIFTSLFNSHIFDFHEGWMYVLGVGVAGGLVLKARGNVEPPAAGGS